MDKISIDTSEAHIYDKDKSDYFICDPKGIKTGSA